MSSDVPNDLLSASRVPDQRHFSQLQGVDDLSDIIGEAVEVIAVVDNLRPSVAPPIRDHAADPAAVNAGIW